MPRLHAIVPTLAVLASLAAAEEPAAVDDTVTVTATRLEVSPFEQPYALHHHDREDLDRVPARTLTDRLNYTPGVSVQKTALNQSSPYVRGLTGEQSLLLFDGVRLSHAMMRPGANQYAAMIPDQSVAAVDVILGSGSTTLGSDALTGAIDFRLAAAGRGVGKAVSPYVTMRGATAEGHSIAAGIDGETGSWAYTLEGGFAKYHDIEGGKDAGSHLFPDRSDDTIPNTGYDQLDFAGRIAYTGLENNRFELAVGRSTQEDAPRPDGYSENATVNTSGAPYDNRNRVSRYYDPQIFTYAHLRHEIAGLGPIDALRTTLSWHQHDEEQFRKRTNGGNTKQEWNDTIDSFGLDIQATTRLEAHLLTYGVSGYLESTENTYRQTRFDGTQNAGDITATANPGLTTVPDGSEYRTLSAYIQDYWTVASRWHVLGGLRFDRFDWSTEVTDSRAGYNFIDPVVNNNVNAKATFDDGASGVTGNLRLAWDASETVMGFTGVSTGLRAPNLSNIAGVQDSGSSGQQIQGNPNLDPETSITGEVGVKYASERDSASLTLFATQIDDLIQAVYPSDGSLPTLQNAETALLMGGEVANDIALPTGSLLADGHRLAFHQATSYVDGEADLSQFGGDVEEQNIAKANRLFGVAGLRYEAGASWWTGTQVRWSDRYDEPSVGDAVDARHLTFQAKGGPAGAMPGYAVLDWLVGWKSVDGHWFATGEVENILDHSYRVPGSGADSAGLNLILTIGARL